MHAGGRPGRHPDPPSASLSFTHHCRRPRGCTLPPCRPSCLSWSPRVDAAAFRPFGDSGCLCHTVVAQAVVPFRHLPPRCHTYSGRGPRGCSSSPSCPAGSVAALSHPSLPTCACLPPSSLRPPLLTAPSSGVLVDCRFTTVVCETPRCTCRHLLVPLTPRRP